MALLVCLVPFASGYALTRVPAALLPIVQYIGFEYHFNNLARGVIDTRDLIFYGSVVALFLHLAVWSLERRRRRMPAERCSRLWARRARPAHRRADQRLGGRTFLRADLTEDRLYSLDLASRTIMYRLEKPLVAKVYFTGGLQAPYNNHEQALVDKLEDFRAYSRGLMEIEVVDPTNVKELEEEARRFGIEPIQYRYRSSSVTEMKRVFMGVALVYGGRQQVLPAVTRLETLEYDLARAVKALVTEEEPRVIGWTVSSGEPNLLQGQGPLGTIRDRLAEDYVLKSIELGGEGGVDEEVDALFVVGPQRPLTDRALYQLDQFLMRGGALAVFVTNTKPDLRTLRPRNVYHGLEPILGHYGIKLNRDSVVDRAQNGVMRFPVRQGKYMVQMPVNYPLIPRATELDRESAVVKDLDNMLVPFTSSLDIAENLPSEIEPRVLASTSPASGRIKGIQTVDPNAYKVVAGGEERGSFPVLISMTGTWPSFFADKDIRGSRSPTGRPGLKPGRVPPPDWW